MAGANALDDPSTSLLAIDVRGNPVTLTALAEGLRVSNSGKARGSHASTRTIPYYNITCVEIGRGGPSIRLNIEFVANPEKLNFKIEKESWQVSDKNNEPNLEAFRDKLHHLAYPAGVKFGKRAYIVVNPNSGPGNGAKKWEHDVRPLFDAARITYDVVFLKKGGEATELVTNLAIDGYDMIVSVSGDGTPHEIFNGLAKKDHGGRALRTMPIAHIPTGSGNALALNLYGTNKPPAAALAIIKGYTTKLDLVSITQGDKRYVSFLSQALGIIAESDLGTEHLRWMGAHRFEVGLTQRVFQKKCFPCDLAIKVVEDTKDGVKTHYRQRILAPQAEQDTLDNAADESDGLPELRYGNVNEALPEGWELVPHNNLGNFYCGNLAFMAPDANFFPGALPADGCMDLVRINGDLAILKATSTLLAVESGKFFDMEQVRYQKIKAYRIIPKQKEGYLSIDGEKFPFQPFQAEMHQALGRVISKVPGKFQAAGPNGWDKLAKQPTPRASKAEHDNARPSVQAPESQRAEGVVA